MGATREEAKARLLKDIDEVRAMVESGEVVALGIATVHEQGSDEQSSRTIGAMFSVPIPTYGPNLFVAVMKLKDQLFACWDD